MYRPLFLSLSLLSVACPKPVCGDNTVEENEACDDGNLNDADGCEADCSLPACNNGIVDPGELCLSAPISVVTDTAPSGIIAADLDGDGSLDIATSNAAGESISVLAGDGAGGFSRLADIDLAGAGFPLVVGDFDGDTILDLATVLITGPDVVEVFQGIGDGTFAPLATLPSTAPESLAAGDFNKDGRLDLVAGGAGVDVFLNSVGGFLAPLSFSAVFPVVGLAVGTFDEDAFLDVVVTHGINEDTLRVLLGDGAGNLSVQAPQPAGSIPGDLLAQDLDGDETLDLAVVRSLAGEVGLLMGNGAGTFSEAQTLSIVGPQDTTIGDVDQDGELDLAIASDLDPGSFISHLALSLGEGAGEFSEVPPLPASNGNLRGVVVADFNEDGALDAILTDQSNAQLLLFLSQP